MPTGPPGAYGLPPMPPVQRSASSATSMSGAPRSTSSLPQVKLGGSGGLRRIGSANHSAEVATSLHRQPGSAEYPHYVLAPRISSDSSCSRKSQQLLPSLDIGSYTAPGTRYAGLNQDVVSKWAKREKLCKPGFAGLLQADRALLGLLQMGCSALLPSSMPAGSASGNVRRWGDS
jgi:hypothetical protein